MLLPAEENHLSYRESTALPERVLQFKKSVAMNWKALIPSLRDGIAVDNIMRIDLRHFCRSAHARYIGATPDFH